MKRYRGWILGLAIVLVLGAAGWRAAATKAARQAAQTAPPQQLPIHVAAQEVLTAAPQQLELGVPVSGVVQAVDSAVVKAYVAGELRGLQLREGDSVRKGQELARVDATEVQARWRQARQQADAAKAQLAIARRQHDNNLALVQQGFISSTALATSHANLDAATANLAAAEAAADAARKSVTDAVILSPMDGLIAQRFVQSGERVGVEARVVEIVDPRRLEVVAQLAPAESVQVRTGQLARLRVPGAPADMAPIPAQVMRINPSAQTGSRTVAVYLGLLPATPDGGQRLPQLRPGLFLEGSIVIGQAEQLAVPLTAVRTDKPQPHVQLLQAAGARDSGAERAAVWHVRHRSVELGRESAHEGQTWVQVRSGLQAGERVLAGSAGGLREGTAVVIDTAAASTESR